MYMPLSGPGKLGWVALQASAARSRPHSARFVKEKHRQIPWLTLRKAVWADLAKRRPSSRKADSPNIPIFMNGEVTSFFHERRGRLDD